MSNPHDAKSLVPEKQATKFRIYRDNDEKYSLGMQSCRNEGHTQNVQVSGEKGRSGLSARPEMRFQDEPAFSLLTFHAINLDVKKALAEACPEFFASLPDKKY